MRRIGTGLRADSESGASAPSPSACAVHADELGVPGPRSSRRAVYGSHSIRTAFDRLNVAAVQKVAELRYHA